MHDDAYSFFHSDGRGCRLFGCSLSWSKKLLLSGLFVVFMISCVVEACSTSTCLLGSAESSSLRSSEQRDTTFQQRDDEVLVETFLASISTKAMA